MINFFVCTMNGWSVALSFRYLYFWDLGDVFVMCMCVKGTCSWDESNKWVSLCLWVFLFVFPLSNFTKWYPLRTLEIFMSHFLYQTFRSTINQTLAITLAIWLGMKARGVFYQSLKPKVSPLRVEDWKMLDHAVI